MGLGSDDEEILRLNAEIGLIPEDRLRAAQVRRRQRALEGDSAPDILELLALEGEISPEVERRYRERLAAIALPGAARTPTPPEVIEAQRHARNRFGNFVLIREVGRGGMGTVHRAWDTRVGRIVALKIILGSSPEAVERFVREARIAGRLRHPSIATVYEAGEAAGRHYIAMQFIEGAPIDKIPRPMDQTLRLVRDAARALHYAHGEGIVHRDIKPGNLLVDGDERVYITDFGTAKEFSSESTKQLSYTSTIIGTPQYMSPEQIQSDSKRVDARSDVYSLGATLYALLAGRPPFNDENIGQILVAVMRQPAPTVRVSNRAASPELDASLQRSMAKDPAKRYKTAQHFADELDRLVREKRYTGRYGLARLLAKRWLPRFALALVAVAAVRLGLLALSSSPSAEAKSPWDRYLHLSQAYERNDGDPNRLHSQVIREIDKDPEVSDLYCGRILRASALFDVDDRKGATEALDKLGGTDYRIPYLRALEELERETEREPALPAAAGPGERQWLGIAPAWPPHLRPMFEAVVSLSDNAAVTAEELLRDRDDAREILRVMAGRLENTTYKHKHGRVFRKAVRRAAYITGKFQLVLESSEPLPRERHGALLWIHSDAPDKLPPIEGDPAAEGLRRALLARADVDEGRDPSANVKAGLEQRGAHPEVRAYLLATHARWLLLSHREAPAVEECWRELGSAEPSTWLGRLALVEAHLARGIGRLRERDGQNARANLRVVEEILPPKEFESWQLARAILSEALLAARRDVTEVLGKPTSGAGYERALLCQASAQIETAGAAAPLEALLRRHPRHAVGLYLSGRVHHAAGRIEPALAAFDAALKEAPDYIDAMTWRAYTLWRLKRHDEAMATADAIVKLVPADANALEWRGTALYALGKYAAAIDDWKKAVEIDPEEYKHLLPDIIRAQNDMRRAEKKP